MLIISSSSSASSPVGTTVRVQDFLKLIPVRRQTVVKRTAKVLSDIKNLLHAYAFARPGVRLVFKVLKAKNEKANWSYGPKPGATTLEDAAAKIVGIEVATQCELKSSKSILSDDCTRTLYTINTLLPKAEAGVFKYSCLLSYAESVQVRKSTMQAISFLSTVAQYLL